jgi:single-strand DNA-binding protein
MSSYSVNKVTLLGNITRDGEVNFTPSGTAVCSFTVATNRVWKNANGDQQEEASFHRVNVWGKFGETLAKILVKGMKVYVEGILTYREKRDEAGKMISKDASIRADNVIILDRSGKSVGHDDMESSSGEANAKAGGEFDLDAIAQGLDDAKPAATSKSSTPVVEDDLPF